VSHRSHSFSAFSSQLNIWCPLRDGAWSHPTGRRREQQRFHPPAEDKVKKIAEIIGRDPDELLALAGRVSQDLTEIIRRHPPEMASFLRAANGLTANDMARLARDAQKTKGK
jgi:hypothetical protein